MNLVPDRPAVSVVVTCYNQADVIRGTLMSVLTQDNLDLICEIIVVDDGSTDDSMSVLRSLERDYALIRIVAQANEFVSAARNRGISESVGTHVAILDGDDQWLPGRLTALRASLAANLEAGLHYVGFIERLPNGYQRRPFVRCFTTATPRVLETLFLYNASIIPSAVVIRRDVLDVIGGFDAAMAYNEEAEMWMRIATKFLFCHDPTRLVMKAVTPGSMGQQPERRTESQRRTTERLIELAPELARLRSRRDGLICYKRAVSEIRRGRRRDARPWLLGAFRARSMVSIKALVRLLQTVPFPSSVRQR